VVPVVHLTFACGVEAPQNVEESGLAAARRSQDYDKFSREKIKVHPPECRHLAPCTFIILF